MTKVNIRELNDGFVFECTGHSGFAHKGSDIVCAGISVLCIALANEISRLSDENILSVEYFHCADGEMYAEIKFAEGEICRFITLEMLKTVTGGFEALESMYPDYITIE